MDPTSLEQSSGSVYAILVTFTWGTSSVTRYCRWTDDITIGPDTWTAEPTLKVTDLKIRGGTEDDPATIQMISELAPFNTLLRPYAHAKVNVTIEEVDPSDTSTRRVLFTGKVSKITSRADGVRRLGRAKCAGIKALLQGAFGVQATTGCILPFGGVVCAFDLEAAKVAVVIAGLNVGGIPNRIKLSPSDTTDLNPNMWTRGWFLHDGLHIVIRRCWNNGDKDFDLREIPPPEWAGATVLMYPGCVKDPAACAFHGRTESFSGFGYSIPDRNPQYQE